MLIAYIDESYTRDRYFLGAAIAEQETWEAVDEALGRLRLFNHERHGTPLDVELHGHPLMGGRGGWEPLRGQHREAAAIYRNALGAASDLGVKFLFRGVDVARLNARYSYPHPPHQIVLQHLLERINEHCHTTAATEECIVVADQVPDQENHQKRVEQYQYVGTPGYRASNLERISQPIQFSDSSLVGGLQIADLAVYLHRRREVVTTADNRALKQQERIWQVIAPQVVHMHEWRP